MIITDLTKNKNRGEFDNPKVKINFILAKFMEFLSHLLFHRNKFKKRMALFEKTKKVTEGHNFENFLGFI